MLKIINPKQSPNGHFTMTVPATGFRISHYDYTSFVNLYLGHLRDRGIQVEPNWEETMQDELCRQNNWKGVCESIPENVEKPVSAADLKNFLKTVADLIDNAVYGEETFVAQEEANRRAAICKTCPENIHGIIQWCSFCPGGVLKALNKFFGYFRPRQTELTTPDDNHLFACRVCHCSNSAQVHVSTSILKRVKGDYQYPDHCWKHDL
jgi:hypothetical protein